MDPLDMSYLTNQINSVSRSFDAQYSAVAEEKLRRHNAILNTAENTKKINSKVESIEKTICEERAFRELADSKIQLQIDKIIESQKYTNLKATIIGIIGAAAGVAFTVIATKLGWL